LPFFTIVTISYNSSQWIRQAIETVLASSFTDFEYLIADDCSTDESWNIISTYTDPRIVALKNEVNLGEYPNRNAVLQKARGKYVLYVDGDDALYHHSLRNVYEYLHFYPGVVCVWGVSVKELSFVSLPQLLSPEEIIRWTYLANVNAATNSGLAETVFEVGALKKIGGFPTRFVSGDIYTKKRIALEGDVLLIPMGLVYWRRTPGQASAQLAKSFTGFVNNVLIDRSIVPVLRQKSIDVNIAQIETNIRIRDIKLLFTHTVLRFRFLKAWQLFRKLDFRLSDLLCLFKKGDYSYRQQLPARFPLSDFHFKRD
jgi:glycosyltransferase involved in cell wall biosynthesis